MRNLPYLPRVAAVVLMVVVAGLSASAANATQRLTTFEARAGMSVNATVATFTDADPNARASHYDALISWGDGDRSHGTVQRRADGSFAVRGKHTYDRQGTRKVVVRITDGVGQVLDAKVTSWAIVRR